MPIDAKSDRLEMMKIAQTASGHQSVRTASVIERLNVSNPFCIHAPDCKQVMWTLNSCHMSTASSDKRLSVLTASAIGLVAFAPVFMVLIPWDFGSDMNRYRGFMRGLSLTVPLLEMMFVLLATMRGFSLFAAVREVPELSKVGFAMLIAVTIAGAASASKVPIFSLLGLGKIIMHALFFLAVRDQIKTGGSDLRNSYWVAIGFGLLAYWAVWGINIWAFDPKGKDWIIYVPGVTNVRSLGFFAVAGLFAGLAIALPRTAARFHYAAGIVIAVAALVLVFWTGSRGALLAVVVGLLALSIFASVVRTAIIKFSLLAFAAAISISLLLPSVNPSYGIDRIFFGSVTTAKSGADLSSGRIAMWKATVETIKDRPLVGWGVEQFAVSGPKMSLGHKQPHNMILQLLFATGILGAIAALLIILPFLPRLSWNLTTPDRLAAWGVIVGTLTFGLYDAAFYYTYPVMIFLLAVAMVLKPAMQTSASDRSG